MRISIQINKLFIIWRKLWIRFVTLCNFDLVTISNASRNLIVCYMFQLHPEALYLLGAVYLTGDCVKKDIEAEAIDYHITPSMNEYDNKETIRKNFIKICKRSGIEMNNDKPIYLEDIHLGMEYLQYKGFNQNVDILGLVSFFLIDEFK